jgi:hypothetical protein
MPALSLKAIGGEETSRICPQRVKPKLELQLESRFGAKRKTRYRGGDSSPISGPIHLRFAWIAAFGQILRCVSLHSTGLADVRRLIMADLFC